MSKEATTPYIVAVAGRKGGAGKTTTAYNLAGALRRRGHRVLLVDLDPQASLTRLLFGEAAAELEGIGTRIIAPARGVDGLAQPVCDGIDIFPGDRAIESATFALVDNPTAPFRLRKLLAPVRDYDMIILDTPPHLGFALNIALLAAHLAIFPTRLMQQDVDALSDTLDLRAELEELGGAACYLVVPNEVRQDRNDQYQLKVLGEAFGSLLSAPIPHAVAIKYALNQRRPVIDHDARSTASLAYVALANRVEAVRHGQT